MPRRELARKTKRPPRAAPALRTAALRPMDVPDVAVVPPQPSHDNQGLIARYLASRDLRPNSRAAYRADLWAFATALGPQSLLDVRPDDVRAWLAAHTRDPGVPGSTGTWTPRTAALRPMDVPDVAVVPRQPWHDNQGLIARYLASRDLRPNSRAA